MSDKLQTITIKAPGWKGLNTEDSQANEEMGWATVADNCVFDDNNRLATRKGYTKLNTSDSFGTDIIKVGSFRDSATSSKILTTIDPTAGASANNKIYAGVGANLTSETGSLTPNGGAWKFVSFQDATDGLMCIGVQDGETPIFWDGAGGTDFAAVTYPATGANLYDGFPINGNEILSAFNRLWVVSQDRTTVAWCKLRECNTGANDWTTSGGYLNVSAVWPESGDYIVALAAFDDKLVIFGERNILIYANAYTPDDTATPLALDTGNQLGGTISGIGCIARDSVCSIGDDVFFLSHLGVRSLKRSMITESYPTTDVTNNVRDYLNSYVRSISDGTTNIDATYNEKDGFYLLLLKQGTGTTSSSTAFYINTHQPLEDGTYRVTRWPGLSWTSVHYDKYAEEMYIGTNDGFLARYTGYQDDGAGFTLEYMSTWKDFESPNLKFPKKMSMVVTGGSSYTVNFQWGFDFDDDLYNVTSTFAGTNQNPSEWNIAEWGAQPYANYTEWAASTPYAQYDIVVPSSDNGYLYTVADAGHAGTSGLSEPTWDTSSPSGTTSDGGVTWTTRALATTTSEWSGVGTLSSKVHAHLSKNGQHMRYGWSTQINGDDFAVNRLDLMVKVGRLNRSVY